MRTRLGSCFLAAGALVAAAACTDRDPTGPGIPRHGAPTVPHLSIAVSSPDVALLSVEVTAPDLKEALVYDLSLQDGKSETSLALPAGAERRLVIRGHDRYGEVTHVGEVYLEKVGEGESDYLKAELKPVKEGKGVWAEIGLVGEEPQEAVIQLYAKQREPLEGESVVLQASVLDPSGKPLDVRPDELHWVVSDPRGGLARPATEKDGLLAVFQAANAVGVLKVGVVFKDHINWIDIYIRRNPYTTVSAGSSHTCALRSNGWAFCWGNNYRGQLGTAAVPSISSSSCSPMSLCRSATPRWVGGYAFTAISAAGNNTCGLTSTGAIYCWGSNYAGQLGDGTFGGQSPTPVLVKGSVVFRSVTVGYSHVCGLDANGYAYCWGRNGEGQLGNGTTRDSALAGLVGGGMRFRAISAGGAHTCGIADRQMYDAGLGGGGMRTLGGGTQMYCWGSGFAGQLGNGTTGTGVQVSWPTPVSSSTGFTGLGDYESSNSSCALTVLGAGWCWGDNYTGQLGTGSTTPETTPASVKGGLAFTGLSISSFHACGVTTGNDAYCWGFNGYGELGNATSAGTSSTVNAPVPVVGGHKFTQVSVGFNHSCAVRTDGRILCWGIYSGGELGNGMTGPTPTSYTYTPQLVL